MSRIQLPRLQLLFGLLLLCGALDASAAEPDNKGFRVVPRDATPQTNRYAFLVGVNDYDADDSDRLGNLAYCEADVKALKEKLQAIGFKVIYMLPDGTAYSWQPTKKNIMLKLSKLLASVDKDDLVMVVLSGHGVERTDSKTGKLTAFFCPTDAESEKTETLLPIEWFYKQLDQSKAGMKLMFVDACRDRAEPITRSTTKKPLLTTEQKNFMKSLAATPPPRGIMAMLSCESGQVSREPSQLKHGVFLYYLLRGLDGDANTNRDSRLTLGELASYIAEKTADYVKHKLNDGHGPQTPILKGEIPLNYTLVNLKPKTLDPGLPGKLTLAFSVRANSSSGKLLEGARVSLLYRASSTKPEATVATATTDASGKCNMTIPGYWSGIKGDFLALIEYKGVTKRWRLTDFPGDRHAWNLYCPTLAKDFTNRIAMKFKLIPAGEFMMGSPESEKFRYDDEGPVHRVKLTKPFYLGVHEVTQGEFEKVMGTSPWKGKNFVKEGSDYPASYISWDDAVEFCKKLSAKEGRTYRLPTEAEWEYACRAGSKTAHSFGADSSKLGAYAWCNDNTAKIGEYYAHLVG